MPGPGRGKAHPLKCDIDLSKPSKSRVCSVGFTSTTAGQRTHGDPVIFNTIANLLSQAEQVACFRNAARHLVPGGRFVIELWVPELRRLPPGQQAAVWRCEPGHIALQTYDVVRQHVMSHHFTFDESRHTRLSRCPLRYIWPAELDLMAQLAGFDLESRHADWSGSEFTAESRSHVSVYRLPPGH